MSNNTFQVLRLSTFVFNKCSEIIVFTIIFVVKSIIRARRVLIGKMLAQRRRRWPKIISQLGQCTVLFHKMGQIFHQWLACVNAGQPVISPGTSPARQAQNWLRPAHEMGSSPHTVRARKIYPPKSYLGLHPVYCVAANMDAVNHVSSRRAGQARSGRDRARAA